MLKTYTLEAYKSNFEQIIRNRVNEPVIIKNENGQNYLLLPFSPEKIQDIFLMIYQTFNEINKKPETEEQPKKELDLNKFSFMQSIEATKGFNGSFSDAVIEERRAEL